MPSNGVGVSHFVDEGEVLDDSPITVDPQSRKWPGRRTSVADVLEHMTSKRTHPITSHKKLNCVIYIYVYTQKHYIKIWCSSSRRQSDFLSLSISLSLYLSISLSISLSLYLSLSISLSLYLSLYLSISLSISLSLYLSISLSLSLFLSLSLSLSRSLSIYLSVCLSVCLSIRLSDLSISLSMFVIAKSPAH